MRACLGILLAVAACGGSSQSGSRPQAGGAGQTREAPPPPTTGGTSSAEPPKILLPSAVVPEWARGEPPRDFADGAFAWAVGTGPDLQASQAAATTALLEKLWGSSSSTADAHPLVAALPPTEELSVQLQAFADETGLHTVLLATRVDDFSAWAKERLASPARFGVADGMAPLVQIQRARGKLDHLAFHHAVCARRPELARCPPPPLEPARKALAELAARITVTLQHPAGIAVRPGEAPRRDVRVRATWETELGYEQALADLPLLLHIGGELHGRTDGQGQLTSAFLGPPTGDVVVSVDRETLLDRHAGVWPAVEARAPLRQLTALSARIAVKLEEKAGAAQGARFASEAVARGLKQRNHRLVELAAELLPRPELAARIADASGGDVDVVVVGEVESRFASRMGARSVWHDATGTAIIIDAWNGTELGRATDSVQAVGIGDEDAAARALEELGGRLAEKIAIALTRAWGAPLQSSLP